ncbi:MAG: DUF6506 family protein [Thermoplasmata archaeon]
MKFKSLFIAECPDADMEKHREKMETDMYVLYVNLVRDQEEALEVAESYASEKEIDSMILCPGFTHEDVAEISESLDDVGVTVARGDGPSGEIAQNAMKRAGWFE